MGEYRISCAAAAGSEQPLRVPFPGESVASLVTLVRQVRNH